MWPVLARDPWMNADLHTYGVLLLVGLAVGVGVTTWLGSRDRIEPADSVRTGLLVAVSALVGMKVMAYVNASPTVDLAGLFSSRAFAYGNVLYGGIFGGVLASLVGARTFGFGWWRLADAAAPGIAFGIALGRLGCFAGGCCAGTVCAEPWGVLYPVETVERFGLSYLLPLHPVQLYEAALAAALGVYLVRLHGRRTFEGQSVLAFFVLYPLVRFVVEFWRGDDRGELFGLSHATGLSPSQLISIALAATAFAAIARRRRSDPPRPAFREPESAT